MWVWMNNYNNQILYIITLITLKFFFLIYYYESIRDSAINNNDNNFVTWILLKVNFKSLCLFNYQKEILLYPL